jgi:hypothetical protein
MFPEAAINLNEEIRKHPRLQQELSQLGPHAHLEMKVAIIAKYVDVIMDGEYSESRLAGLFDLLLRRLKDKTKLIVH